MSSLLTPGADARSRTLYFLTHPQLWECWPFLPVMRRRPGQTEEELGVVFDALGACGLAGFSATVFIALCGDPHNDSYADLWIMRIVLGLTPAPVRFSQAPVRGFLR
jgi:hypothetical protein